MWKRCGSDKPQQNAAAAPAAFSKLLRAISTSGGCGGGRAARGSAANRTSRRGREVAMQAENGDRMRRVIVDHYGGPRGLANRGRGRSLDRVQARCASGCLPLGSPTPMPCSASARISACRSRRSRPATSSSASSRSSVPDCSRLRVGDRIGTLTVWGADAERVCVLEANAVEVPEDLDPGEVMSLVFTHMTAYQLLHRTARVKSGESGARARGGREGGHGGSRARGGRWTSHVRDLRPLAISQPSSGSAPWRSTTAPRTSWRACAS